MKKILVTLGLTLALSTHYTFAASAAAGTVNGMTITVEEANKALNTLTKGKMTWETLSGEDKKKLIERMAVEKLLIEESKKSLTDKEKETALASYWMQKKISTTEVTDKEAEDIYNKMKKSADKAKSTQQIPPLEAVKDTIKMQIAQEKVVAELMKNAKIKIK